MLLTLDTQSFAVDIYTGDWAVINNDLFGLISRSNVPGYDIGYEQSFQLLGGTLVRWPGGTLSEIGLVTSSGNIALRSSKPLPIAYDLTYPELIHPLALSEAAVVKNGLHGLSEMLQFAIDEGAAFSMILPTQRYEDNPAKSFSETLAFLERMFVNDSFNAGVLPDRVILEIGNENYDPSTYGEVAVHILKAVRMFRDIHPDVQFEIAMQAMQNGPRTIELIDYITQLAAEITEPTLLAEVEIVRMHYLNHGLETISNVEDRNIYWALLRMQNAIMESRLAEGGSGDARPQTYFSAWTVNSNDVEVELGSGLPGAQAVLSWFTAMAELGADLAAGWGVAAADAIDTTLSYIDTNGAVKITPQGAIFELLSENVAGARVLNTDGLDAGRSVQVSTYGFSFDDRIVLYLAANDLIEDRLHLELDIQDALRGESIQITSLTAENGTFGQAVLKTDEQTYLGGGISVAISDYEVVQVIIPMSGEARREGTVVYGTPLGERLIGTENDDTFTAAGTDHGDFVRAGSGNDRISFDSSSHFLNGDAGDDIFIFQGMEEVFSDEISAYNMSGHGQVGTGEFISVGGMLRISSVIDGGSGYDILALSEGSDAFFFWDDLSDRHDRYTGPVGECFTKLEEIRAGAGDDVIDLTAPEVPPGVNRMKILGERGNDTIWGSPNDEWIDGGDGNDMIFGGAGSDTLVGGLGSDTFVFTATSTNSIILDFSPDHGDSLKFVDAGGFRFLNDTIRIGDDSITISIVDQQNTESILTIGL